MTQVRKPARSPRQAAARAGPLDRLLDPDLFKALADPTRLRLLACLAKCGRPCSVSEVAECCTVDFSVVSRHLALLARAGVLDAAKEGRVVSYSVNFDRFAATLRALADAIEHCRPEDCYTGGCCDGAC